ncbi:MAG TPA: serine/threonine-protein kinase [Acidimicrobiia bacterium]|nr:serine/threonine-protein kinase [Acidimicrobiia bacterium]
MAFGPSSDSSDSAHSLSSGVFDAVGIQVKGTCGSSFVTDVIRVDRTGVQSAVKILTPGATQDPELVSRFLMNARYNQGLNDFTGMRITEIVETGTRPYYVMEKVAESSLLEIIRLHAPVDPRWLATLLLPVARMLDTIHQRNILHANIKPSNILVTVENGGEKFLLVDFFEPSLAATSATLTGAGVYAAPEFRAGMPVSNRSDIYSLAAVMYEALSGSVPASAYRSHDGDFHVWRAGDQARDLSQINPEISRSVSEIIMNGISPQAISRPASASAMVEDVLRLVEQPRTPIRTAEPEHHPVPMLLIIAGVFMGILLLFGAFKLVSGIFGGSTKKDTVTTTTVAQTTTTTTAAGVLSARELSLFQQLAPGNQECDPDRSQGSEKVWPLSIAALTCTSEGVTRLEYGSFANKSDLDDTFDGQAKSMATDVVKAKGEVVETQIGIDPCATTPNESGEWQIPNTDRKGQFMCVSVPQPRIVWTEGTSRIIGDAELSSGTMTELIAWWKVKAGPQ